MYRWHYMRLYSFEKIKSAVLFDNIKEHQICCSGLTLVRHQVTLRHIWAIGLSPHISLVFPKIFIARGQYLKYFQRFKRKISSSTTHWNDSIKLMFVTFCNGTLCSHCLFSPFFSPELTFMVFIQTKRACWRFISFITTKFSSADII